MDFLSSSNRRKSWIDFEHRGFNEDSDTSNHHRLSMISAASDLDYYRSQNDSFTDLQLSAPDSASSVNTQRSIVSSSSNQGYGDLKAWLNSLQLGEYYESFAANDITFDILTYLKKDDVKKLIPKVGDRIRLMKAIQELTMREQHSLNEASTLSSHFISSVPSETESSISVKFNTLDNKAIHLDVLPLNPIQSLVFQTAKLPSDGTYALHDGFDVYEDDASIKDAIFKRNIREFWIQPERSLSSNADDSDTLRGTNTDTAGLRRFDSFELGSRDRPTSMEVASRISDFFPNSKQELLAEGLRNSMLINKRFSTVGGGWRSSIRSSQRFSTTSIPDTASAASAALKRGSDMGSSSTITGTLKQELDQLSIEQPELDSKLLEKLDSEEMSPSEWFKGKLIGSGSFGSVYLAFSVFTGDIMAVKQVQLLQRDQRQQKMVEAMHREVMTLRSLEHQNIVQYRGFKNEGEFLNIFLEYIPGGSLASKVAKEGALKECTVRTYIEQCLSGLAYLHDRGIVHRDIKGANILIDTDNQVKISDFGLSKHEDAAKQRYSMQGTAFWMAPEVARAREQTTTKADIWSLGCLIIELVTGQHPFPKLQAFQAIYKIGKGTTPVIPDTISPELRDVLESCLKVDPKDRPSAHELLKRPFFQQD